MGARTDIGPPPLFRTPEPRLGFGAWGVGGSGWSNAGDERERLATIHRAFERGITFFDTAPAYGDGASERLLGRALRGHRDRVHLATKVGPREDPRASLEQSLRRLATDAVDLVQLHEALEGWEQRLERLHELQLEGKARAIGLCNATHLKLARACAIAPVVSYQGPYNLFDRGGEQRTLPLCREPAGGLAFLAYRPLAAGLRTGKYPAAPQFPEGDHRRKIYWFKGPEFERRRRVIERLAPVADRLGIHLTALALGWVLARPGVTVVLAGARSPEQVDQQLTGVGPLAPDLVREIDAIVTDVYPPARATRQAGELATTWDERERFIVERLDGRRSPEAIAAEWTDRGDTPMIAAQVKVFVDQLAERELIVNRA